MLGPHDGRGAHPHGLGNHAAIVSEDTTSPAAGREHPQYAGSLRHYTGFSNFDIKYSGTPGDYRVFEINLRQGPQLSYYVTATGMNIAKLVVESGGRRHRLRAEQERGVLAPCARAGGFHLH